MTRHKSSPSPIVEFLGPDAGAGGPFAILGLPHEIESDTQILRASQRRLHQIDLHRFRSTPDASEVRLAVHAAASQLMDANLRAELARRWPAGKPVSVPQAWKPVEHAARVSRRVLSSAKMLIAASGGWNSTARKRLAHLARMNRVGALELVNALCPPPRVRDDLPESAPGDAPIPRLADRVMLVDPPPAGNLDWLAAYGLVFVMAVSVLSMVVLVPAQSPSVSAGSTGSKNSDRSSSGGAYENQTDSNQAHTGHEREGLTHYTAIAHELEILVGQVDIEPKASIERFVEIYPVYASGWEAFPEPALKRAALNISEFVRRASVDDAIFEPISSLFDCASPSSDPSQMMIRAATIDVILSDPTLNPRTSERFALIRSKCFGGDVRPSDDIIEAIVVAAGLAAVDTESDDPQWWGRWLDGVRAATRNDPDQQTRLVLSALSARLRDQSVPGEQWKSSAIKLATALTWREGTPERYWLLSQFADQAVTTPRLAALTSAIGTYSKAPQITAQMVLNPSSTFLQRQELAQVYRSAWEGAKGEPASDGRYADIVKALHLRASITPVRLDEPQAIETIIELARLNTAAWQFADGHEQLGIQSLSDAGERVIKQSNPQALNLSINRRDTQWAEQAINAPNATALSALFSQLVQDDGPGANSGYALVYIATLNPDPEMRAMASTQVVRYRDRPTILIAVDHAIGSSRISSRLEQLVVQVLDAPLPARTDDNWYDHAHRQLLDQLAVSLAQTVESNRAVLEENLELAYRARGESSGSLGDASGLASDSAKRVYQQLLLESLSEPYVDVLDPQLIARIDAATHVRSARSQSPTHLFLAYQRGGCELLGALAVQDIPGSSMRIKDLLGELDSRLAQSKTVLDQIAQIERCIAQLWILRLEGKRL
jgi:hypothetical protein